MNRSEERSDRLSLPSPSRSFPSQPHHRSLPSISLRSFSSFLCLFVHARRDGRRKERTDRGTTYDRRWKEVKVVIKVASNPSHSLRFFHLFTFTSFPYPLLLIAVHSLFYNSCLYLSYSNNMNRYHHSYPFLTSVVSHPSPLVGRRPVNGWWDTTRGRETNVVLSPAHFATSWAAPPPNTQPYPLLPPSVRPRGRVRPRG